jgi:3-oxoacyl-[acyl-carrier protein] reductase
VDLGIAGKVALVSGGSKGMGRATAEELAREGCRVVVTARGKEAVDETVEAIRAEGGTAIGVPGDFTNKDEIERIVATAKDELGPVEIAVFNVYGPTHGTYDDVTDAALQGAYNDMVMALHWMTQSVLPDMKAANWGRLVTINSVSSKEVHRELPLFTANLTRVAAVSFNKTLSAEVGKHGITVNTMGTGGFLTDRYRSYMQQRAEEAGIAYDEFEAMRRDDVPVGRIGYAEEMSAAIAFLCSTRASFITGQFIVVDGGLVRTLW